MLKIMARKYSREHYLELVRKIKEAIPNAVLTTDIIVVSRMKQMSNLKKRCRCIVK